MPTSKIYHHTPETKEMREKGYCVIEVSSPDSRKGAIGIFSMPMANGNNCVIIPRGINEGLTYKVTLDNNSACFNVSGYELKTKGITASIPSSLTSELVLYEAI